MTKAARIWRKVASKLPADRSFRVSVRVRKGSREAYAYVTCLNPEQFRTWMMLNEPKLLGIVKIV